MWRRFLPHKRSTVPQVAVLPDGSRLSTIRSVHEATDFATRLKSTTEPSDKKVKQEYFRTLVLAQTPQAALAQIEMDRHKYGYRNREKRLYELIDFNDSFVSYVLASPHNELPGLSDRLKNDMDQLCRKLSTKMFSDEQYDAIVRGLSREIAVYRSAKFMGFDVRMTSRTEDAFGIDMVVTQPDTNKVLNIDCKTPPAFRHRLEDLVHHGRIDESEVVPADEKGFITVMQHRDHESVPVTLFCILPDRLGEISDFTFDEPERLKTMLNTVFATIR